MTDKAKQRKTRNVIVSTTIPPDMNAELWDRATAENVTPSALTRYYIQKGLLADRLRADPELVKRMQQKKLRKVLDATVRRELAPPPVDEW